MGRLNFPSHHFLITTIREGSLESRDKACSIALDGHFLRGLALGRLLEGIFVATGVGTEIFPYPF
jgi:hypothetical protein